MAMITSEHALTSQRGFKSYPACHSRSRGGVLILKRNSDKDWWGEFVLVRTNIRGVGERDLVYVVRNELEVLTKEQRALFEE
jgi:hypothetical protein